MSERNLTEEAHRAWYRQLRAGAVMGTASTPPPDWTQAWIISEMHRMVNDRIDGLERRIEAIEHREPPSDLPM